MAAIGKCNWPHTTFEKNACQIIEDNITPTQKEALDQLVMTLGEYYDRPLLTRLRSMTQSIRPEQIKKGLHNFLILKKLFKETAPLLEKLSLSQEASQYYAKWVIQAKTSQITDIANPHKRYLHLLAFIEHMVKLWQDTLVDMLLKCVRQYLNKAERMLNALVTERAPNRTKMVKSVLTGFDDSKQTVRTARGIVHDKSLTSDEKILQLCTIIPAEEKNPLVLSADLDAEKLKQEIAGEDNHQDEFDIFKKLSKKLQNRVASFLKYLVFESTKDGTDLFAAITYYQSVNDITSKAPEDFLEAHELVAVHRNQKFNVSLYKFILFCKIANGIKCGKISLQHSYRYLSIDEYLIKKPYWREHKTALLEKLGLSAFANIEQVLSTLKQKLDQQYWDVNESISEGLNRYITLKKEGGFSLYTPPIDKPDYESIAAIIGKDTYVPILKIMAEINRHTQFITHFKHHKMKGAKGFPESEIFYAGIFGLGSHIGLHKLANTAVGVNFNTLSNTVNWYFSLENLYAVNQCLIELMNKLWLPQQFKREKDLLHTSSDGKKECVSAESLNTNHSFKYFGNGSGASVYRFIDERGILFYSTVFSSAERDAAYVIDGLLHSEAVQSDMHSTDTHGYTEMVFAVSHLMSITFAPRIKSLDEQNLWSFGQLKSELTRKAYSILPTYYVNEDSIKSHWDDILRLIATIKLREHRASTILKRLGEYSNQHALQEALKEFGRIIKSIFILKYIDDVALRQAIEKQLNKGELANKFSAAISFVNSDLIEPLKEDQEISVMCKTIIQNIIILWNYLELTKIIMRANPEDRAELLDNITNASILTWHHVNFHGTYDFSNLLSVNDADYALDEVINFKTA